MAYGDPPTTNVATPEAPSSSVKPSCPSVAAPLAVNATVQTMQMLWPVAGWCRPAGQSMHSILPVTATNFPVAQSRQSILPAMETYFPAAQSRHSELPVTATYFPAAQSRQSDAMSLPATDPYFPVTQSMHSELPATATYFPAAQSRQSDASSLPSTAAYFPAAQLVHAELPAAATYCPAGQSVQSPVPVSNLPAVQAVHVPSNGAVPAGQASQLRLVADAGHETGQASYALTTMRAESVPVAQKLSHASTPGPVATKLAQLYSCPRSVYLHPWSSAHVVQHSAGVQGFPAQATDSAG